ncbi:MAG: MBL fold metallo-hydrolase [Lachnospiraceae bacterium]|nr:MBL fold metallo-hydrolase [Lachnospiraceae bacterium]
MRLCSIASGSSGNCIYIGSDNNSLLIDAGISGKRVEAGLKELDLCGRDVDGVLITHEHSDHIKGLGVLARKFALPIYGTRGTLKAIKRTANLGPIPEELFREIKPDVDFQVGDLTVSPFRVSHDAAEPVAYRLTCQGKSAAVATDLGVYTDYTVEKLQRLDVLLLEANHDIHMLEVGGYPYYLKQRILGERGHLSNESAGQLLCRVLHDNLKRIFLGHLSKENNYAELAYETVRLEMLLEDTPYGPDDFPITVAGRECMSECVAV